ncbi:MAG: hypothetical protein KJN63_10875, partial [Acidimicrobiia bacterium]|nr:hypothetical protein [Acidimicrobiia bacterium]
MKTSTKPVRTTSDGPLTGPAAQVVLTVLQQALLTPQGAEQLLVGVKGVDGRFTVLRAEACTVPPRGRPPFRWSQAAPILASLRLQSPGGSGSVVECGGRYVYRYSRVIDRTRQEVVIGVVLGRVPPDNGPLHAAVSSAVHTLLPESDRHIPDGSVSVSVDSHLQGFTATVELAGQRGPAQASGVARTVATAIAQSTVEASGVPLRIRYADQRAVAGSPVSLIVADSVV